MRKLERCYDEGVMKIIISPAKKINATQDFLYKNDRPAHLREAKELYAYLRLLSYDDLKRVYKASDAIVTKAYNDLRTYELDNGFLNALYAYDGIQYQSLKPNILEEEALIYLDEHLRILSGLYGALRPFDMIVPYRLEMGSKLIAYKADTLYDYWKSLYKDFEGETVINLASKEYSDVIVPYLSDVVSVDFINGNKIKATYAKKARGAFVRFMATHRITDLKKLITFNELGYKYDDGLSTSKHLIFKSEQ